MTDTVQTEKESPSKTIVVPYGSNFQIRLKRGKEFQLEVFVDGVQQQPQVITEKIES